MKKVLLVCDGSHFSEGAFKMAAYLQTLQPVLLTGVFLGAEVFKYVYLNPDYVMAELAGELQDEQEAQLSQSTEHFKWLCEKYHVEYRVHTEVSFDAISDLQKEMRFADVAIIGSETFYKDYDDQQPNANLKSALRHAECPLLLVPENFNTHAGNLLAYDGSANSVYAIKQYATLFPELCSNETLLVYASAEGKDIPDLPYMEELAARHFSNLEIFKLDADPDKFLTTWLTTKKNYILVTGSYGRSGLSNLFRESFINKIIKDHHIPVFIAHR